MNILFFSRLFYPHIGGVEKHVFEVGKILVQKGHKVIIIAEKNDSKLKKFEIISRIEVYRIPISNQGWFKKFEIWSWILKHKDLIKKADIVHCHDVFFWYLPFRFLYFNKPIFITFHGYESYPLKLKSILMHKIAERLSIGNVCVGDFIKKWYGTKPDYVSYGGVNIVEIKDQKSKIKNENSALFVGRLDEQTGIRTYINAVSLIKKEIPNFKLIVLGDGKFRNYAKKEAEVLGFKKNPQEYFKNYRFAFVSRYLSILEAMAAKRLVFAVYDNPLKEDYLRMAPFSKLINVANSDEELAEKVLYFLNNKEKEEIMVNKAFEWVKVKTWESVVQQYFSLWNLD